MISIHRLPVAPIIMSAILMAFMQQTNAATLKSATISAEISQGTISAIENIIAGEKLSSGELDSSLAGLYSIPRNSLMLSSAEIEQQANGKALSQSAKWDKDRSVLNVDFRIDASGDLVISQSGKSGKNGLYGISWGITNIPDDMTVLVPGESGQRLGKDAAAGIRSFDYPFTWESPFVLIQGKSGGVIIYSEDRSFGFKSLFVDHADGKFRIRFESRNQAPFDGLNSIKSAKWRMKAYKGQWQAGAEIYKKQMIKHLKPIPMAKKTPVWAKDIRFAVIMDSDIPILRELAKKVDPAQTIVYIPDWRKYGYDRYYPDYTANDRFPMFVEEAHRLGFKVMAHVNHFGVDPKHPLYEKLKKYHIKDAFNNELQWWWPAADLTIKIAYINPASKEWREIFVSRMKELVEKYKVDALHIDQTLVIWNDANGLIDGMNSIQGNILLHKELYEALPNVAISGEGLDEITCIYETFAQRHATGIDLWNGTWNNNKLEQAHPVSSYILLPYATMYGYLGMTNPASSIGTFNAWRKAYENYGVIPTYPRPSLDQLKNPADVGGSIIDEAVFFQKYHPQPDFVSEWESNDLFRYRLNDGRKAFYKKDNGTAFGTIEHDGSITILSRRLYGSNKMKVNGTIPGWLGYNENELIGLNPENNYFWSSKERDMNATHISDILPDKTILASAGILKEFARFRLENPMNSIKLWEYAGPIKAGVKLTSGKEKYYSGIEFIDASGGNIHVDGNNLLVHPPWMAEDPADKGPVGRTFAEYDITFPKAEKIAFSTEMMIRSDALGKSDGITLYVTATDGTKTLSAKAFNKTDKSESVFIDLSEFSSKNIKLKLEIDAGPDGDPSFDWGAIRKPVISLEYNEPGSIDLVSANAPDSVLTAIGAAKLSNAGGNTYKIDLSIPNTITIPYIAPVSVSYPVKLNDMPFITSALTTDGRETEPYAYSSAKVEDSVCLGDTRRSVSVHPPDFGKTMVDYYLILPNKAGKLTTAIGLKDGSKSKGAGFEVRLNGKQVFSQTIMPDIGWVPVDVDLSQYAGKPVMITFVIDSIDAAYYDWGAWAEPILVSTD